ncbi:TetR/AcrR family transcriptional regulator [Reichenbachiella versicolor]|uniref:TetR/AcrR family transcriptional regulator n=1 Tax=Reichenbachiella versicolor TaxID=1821036 RepID=UPI000D6E6986|nr:TetR/AcrR family transcriptional regulator [Reichenbachiella versicolor]
MDTKEKILQVADGQFHRYGIRSVSMDDIARELGMSKKTIYQYFKDKECLVRYVTESNIQQEIRDFNEVLEKSDNAIDELYKFSLCFRKNLNDINPSLLFDLQKFHPTSWQLWEDFKYSFIKDMVVDAIKRGKNEGVFRQSIDAEVLALYRIESIQLAFDPKIFPKEKFNLVDIQLELFDHFVYGLLTVEGHEIFDKLRNSTQNDK